MDDASDRIQRQAEMLANRVRKNVRHRRKWARRNGVSCYRLYDRDIPELPLAIDLYEGHLHVAEYARGGSETHEPGVVEAWAQSVADCLEIPMEQVFIKSRRRQRGRAQYTPGADTNHRLVVKEGGLSFIVNLADYLDTGLFLDHRQARDLVRQRANGCKVLNLFAYTGAFTVYAAHGAALSTTTVDLSKTYLAWAEANLALNQLDGPQHRVVQADAMAWCHEARSAHERYDIIILDPPTFSNSKRTRSDFDVQRDHDELIRDCLELLAPGGVIYFSNNARRFKMSGTLSEWAEIEEITQQTASPDFTRPSHRCWRVEVR